MIENGKLACIIHSVVKCSPVGRDNHRQVVERNVTREGEMRTTLLLTFHFLK